MSKVNITREALAISEILRVIKNNNAHHHKAISVKERHSDAFVYVISGSCTYKFDDGVEFTVSDSDVIYLPYRSVYTMYISSDDYRFIFCDFKFVSDPTVSMLFPAEHVKGTESLFTRLLAAYKSRSLTKQTECMSILYAIYNALQKCNEAKHLKKDKSMLIASAKRYMEESFFDPDFTVSSLARQANVSDVYFRKLFGIETGISPVKYLNLLRLSNAKNLMKYPFLSLEECALQSGFSSLQYFCRIFKKEFNISPGKYRASL